VRNRTLAAACVFAAVVLAAPAAGAKTLVGTGGSPQAVAGPDGTAHVLWEDDSGGFPVARYCRVAPGGESCAATQSWSASGTLGFDDDVVREPGTGIVHVLVSIWQQGAAPFNQGAGIYDIASTQPDAAGNTWAAPKRITAYTNNATQVGNSHQGTIFGPGAHQIGWLSAIGTPGARLTFGSTGAFGESAVDNLVPSSYESDVGLVDAATPLVVARDGNTGELKWRVYGGSGPVDSAANWKPQGVLPAGATSSDIDLASNGVAAPSLITQQQVGGTDWRVTLRRFDNAANTFTAPATVSEDDQARNPRVFMDSGSNVHALFLSNTQRYAGSSTTGLVYTASSTGDAWPKYGITLDQGTSNADPVLAAGADGAGVAVWTRSARTGSGEDDDVYLGHVGGPASAFPTDPPATPGGGAPPAPTPPDPSCVKAPALGVARLLATGCFKKTTGTQLTTSAPFLVNGVTLDPKGASVTVDTAKRTLQAKGTATTLTMGPIKVGKGAVDWTFPATGTWTKPGGAIDLDAAGYGAELLGLKLTGDATLTLKADGSSLLHGFLRLPPPFDGVTAEMDFKADNFTGLRLDGLKAHVDVLGYGFHDLDLAYTSDPARWTGSLHFSPSGVEGDGVDLGAQIIITNGKLDELSIDAKFPAPGRELYPPLVYLRYAGLGLKVDPLTLTGKVVVAGGPSPGEPLIAVGHPYDDFGTLKLRLESPFSLRADGPVYVLGYKLGSGYFDYTFPGDISFGTQAAVGTCFSSVAAVEAKVDGFVSVGSGFKMNAKGVGRVCLGKAYVKATAVVSSKGIAACAEFGKKPFSVSAGAGLYWGDVVPDFMPLLCDTEPYEVAQGASASAHAAQAGGGRPIKVGSGLRQLTVVATGDSGVPLATLVAPDGTRYAGQSEGVVQAGPAFVVAEPDAKRQSFLVPRPAAGTWTLETAAGSPGVAQLQVARDAPPIAVTGRVTRAAKTGQKRTLTWKVADRATGQTVTLFEQGPGVLRRLAVAQGAAGHVSWTPKTLRGGKRTVTAVVARDGLSVKEVNLGSFTVPPPPRPGAARRVKATHRATALIVTWVPGAHAASQEVRVALGNGLGKIYTVKKGARSLRIPNVASTVTGTVRVTAVRADGARGRTVTATVRKAPARKKKATKKR
jgi:hypothetical protein